MVYGWFYEEVDVLYKIELSVDFYIFVSRVVKVSTIVLV